ncbi:MAG: hypothetical protein GF383_05110 [Candidatus Lokiarchaeota archaeon]|nr:hypothetical protein [Candidatus Lokiarchaeota archaeon]MBD3339271.1 hypothetical protein [Candidatus Lokiarchaeota archaeon]
MKPWLFDIIACPIDKHYPLKLFIFSYESSEKDFESFYNLFKKREIDALPIEDTIHIHTKKKDIFVKDNVVIEEKPIKIYLKLMIESIEELVHFEDRSSSDYSKSVINLLISDVKEKLTNFLKKTDIQDLTSVLPELFLVNTFKVDVEIESGVLYCEECHRWFPIIDTIPQMLPDKYRDKDAELQFLKTNKNLLDEKFFKQNLKPFNI